MPFVTEYGDPTALAMAGMALLALAGFIIYFASDRFET